jgi:drug/metabolite transporter (DMT)-like permease
MLMRPSVKVIALLAGMTAMICWSFSGVLIRYTKDFFTIHFQNFYRFSIALAILWPFVVVTLGKKRIRQSLRSVRYLWPKLAAIALFNYLHQLFLVAGIYRVYPTVAALLEETGILFSVGLAYLVFHDERETIRRLLFQIGIGLSLIGVFLTVTGGQSLEGGEFNLGALFMILSAVAWSVFSILIRLWIPAVPSALATTTVFTIVTPLFFITHLISTAGAVIPQAPPKMWLLLTVSGVVGIGTGYTMYYKSLPALGVTFASSIGLLIPLFTSIISYLILGELLLPIQAVGGTLLLAGCYMVIRVRFKTAPSGRLKRPSGV